MWPPPDEELEELEAVQPALPPRSALFSLKPIGIGTDQVEALSSYVTRLAQAHSVSPRRLIRDYLRKMAPEPENMRWLGHTSQQMSMDGVGKFNQFLIPLLEELTSVKSLQYLTLLPLAELLPSNGPHQLLRHPRWCPDCYLEQIHTPNEAHRHLLWSLTLYRVCHFHSTVMLDSCPACGSYQRYIPILPDLVHCGRCGEPLTLAQPEHSQVTEMDLWKSQALADLIANLAEIPPMLARENLVAFLDRLIRLEVDGKPYPFGHQIRFILVFMGKWITAGKKLSLARLLELGYYAHTLPSVMLIQGAHAPLDPTHFKKERVAIRTPRPSLGITEREHLEQDLSRIVNDSADYRSVTEVARTLGYERTCLQYWFPKQCRAIVLKAADGRRQQCDARHQEEQRLLVQIVKDATTGPVPLKQKQIIACLNDKGLYLVRKDLGATFRKCVEEGADPPE